MDITQSKLLRKPNPAPISRVVCFEKIPKKIRIKFGTWWYTERVGEIFYVLEIGDGFYTVFDKTDDMAKYVFSKHTSIK